MSLHFLYLIMFLTSLKRVDGFSNVHFAWGLEAETRKKADDKIICGV